MNRRLRAVLALLLAASLAPFLLLASWQTFNEAEESRRHAEERLAAVGALAAADLDEALARAEGLSAAVSTRGYAFIVPGGGCRQAMRQLVATDRVLLDIVLTDAEGRVVCSAEERPTQMNFAGLDWFEALKSGAQSRYSGGYIANGSASPTLVVATGISRNDAFQGVAAVFVNATAATRLIRSQSLPEGSLGALVTTQTHVPITAYDEHIGPIEEFPPELMERVETLDGPQSVELPVGGEGYFGVLYPLVDQQIALLIVSPPSADQIWGVVDIAATFLVPFLMYALALTSVWLAVDFFVLRWLGYLRRIAAVYGGGRLDVIPVRARKAPYEFQELADTMAQMATSLEEQRNELAQVVDQRGALLKEIHHRVKNNLQVIVSLLNLQAGRLQEGEAKEALMEARRRINALSLVHRSLYDADNLSAVFMPGFLSDLCRNLSEVMAHTGQRITIDVASDDIELVADQAVPTALFVTEAVTNSYKHAFEGRQTGRIEVTLRRVEGEDRYRLQICDDGVGAETTPSSGTGSSLMRAFAMQIGGELAYETSDLGGLCCVIEFLPQTSVEAG